MRNHSANTALGLGCIAFALILAFIWIPFDTDTGLVERSRGRYIVGDGLAPTMAAVFILISGVMLLLERGAENHHPNRHNMFFIGAIISLWRGWHSVDALDRPRHRKRIWRGKNTACCATRSPGNIWALS